MLRDSVVSILDNFLKLLSGGRLRKTIIAKILKVPLKKDFLYCWRGVSSFCWDLVFDNSWVRIWRSEYWCMIGFDEKTNPRQHSQGNHNKLWSILMHLLIVFGEFASWLLYGKIISPQFFCQIWICVSIRVHQFFTSWSVWNDFVPEKTNLFKWIQYQLLYGNIEVMIQIDLVEWDDHSNQLEYPKSCEKMKTFWLFDFLMEILEPYSTSGQYFSLDSGFCIFKCIIEF